MQDGGNLEKLDEIFKGNNNHEARKQGKNLLGSLDMFLKISKEEFEKMLEEK